MLSSLATEQGADRWDTAQVVVQSLSSNERKVVLRGGGGARYVPTGHLVYALGTTLLVIPFDMTTLEVRGGPVPILEGVRRAQGGGVAFGISTTGSLVYVPGLSATSVPQTGWETVPRRDACRHRDRCHTEAGRADQPRAELVRGIETARAREQVRA